MILHRLVGSCVAAISFVLFGLALLSRGSSDLGPAVMDRLGFPFAAMFLATQVVLCLVFVRPKDRIVPLLLFAGGTVLYFFLAGKGGAAEAARMPLHHALITGSSFSGLTAGALIMMGDPAKKPKS